MHDKLSEKRRSRGMAGCQDAKRVANSKGVACGVLPESVNQIF